MPVEEAGARDIEEIIVGGGLPYDGYARGGLDEPEVLLELRALHLVVLRIDGVLPVRATYLSII